jgi:hypothetical protein
MPFVPGLEFVENHLSVAYRASDKPQTLEIRATIEGVPAYAMAPAFMLWFERAMCAGAAGGAEFSPLAGHAEHVSGPLKPGDEGTLGPYRWELTVTAISPFFIRNLVQRLAAVGAKRTTSVSITGSLSLDDSPLSVREATVIRWLDDSRAFMKAWPDVGFPVKTKEGTKRAATTRLRFKGTVDKKLVEKVELAVGMWRGAINMYPNLALTGFGSGHAGAKVAKTKSEVVCTYEAFDFVREPSLAVLINMLAYFHARVAPIAEAEITLPVD